MSFCLPKPVIALAPMAGVSDLAFREICREFGANFAVTEMISAKALMYQDKKTRTLLASSRGDAPLFIQLFGSDPVCMAEAAAILASDKTIHCAGLDINMGCPMPKIANSGDGSALLSKPGLAAQVAQSVVQAAEPCGLRISVKIRLCNERDPLTTAQLACTLSDTGIAFLTVHGRTRPQMYSGSSDADAIAEVRQAVPKTIPVIANGDVRTAQDAADLLRQTGCDGVMVGRGAYGNPWLFREIHALLSGEAPPEKPTLAEKCEVFLRQLHRAGEVKGEMVACLEARRHFCWYLKGERNMKPFRERIVMIKTAAEAAEIAREIVLSQENAAL
ncbi:MAG: tRNA dihydrouridine synthase DusB [Oscillospiraceae bacterium]|jgi:tRNA-dihydrouridine synthase B|nr:tRNA dihydrouridine synthase DusB [Oscillospiraceae bacterium]